MTLCGCGCGQPPRKGGVYVNRAHYLAAGGPARSGTKGGWMDSRRRERDAIRRIARELGGPVTARDVAMFKGGRKLGYNAWFRRGESHGYRKGFADALGERVA